eukprot:746756-Hanusia_phi.AAC.5
MHQDGDGGGEEEMKFLARSMRTRLLREPTRSFLILSCRQLMPQALSLSPPPLPFLFYAFILLLNFLILIHFHPALNVKNHSANFSGRHSWWILCACRPPASSQIESLSPATSSRTLTIRSTALLSQVDLPSTRGNSLRARAEEQLVPQDDLRQRIKEYRCCLGEGGEQERGGEEGGGEIVEEEWKGIDVSSDLAG